jgi:alkaline phosphatase D
MDRSITRREAIASMLAMGGTFLIAAHAPTAGTGPRGALGRVVFPNGVASGDPTQNGVVLWTRAVPIDTSESASVTAQVSRSPDFEVVVAQRTVEASPRSDHTIRMIVEDLDPATTYFYRFLSGGDVSTPIGRTRTAPAPDSDVAVNLGFVSCQHMQLGHMSPYRRLIEEDSERSEEEQLDFILHLGDFIYEELWYPEERPTFLRRRVRDTVRLRTGGGTPEMRWPVTLDDYRAIYRAYLSDPDLIAARARWPFVCVWDDHEFSNNSWQSQQVYEDPGEPAQRRKVAANQAWFEFIPAFLTGNPGVPGVMQTARDFGLVEVEDVPLDGFDENFQSSEPNNIAALNSLRINRSLRWGRHVELILTDNRSFRSPPPLSDPGSEAFNSRDVPSYAPQEVIAMLDAGRTWNGGVAPQSILFAGERVPNPRHDLPPGTVLGPGQKRWFKQSVVHSDATWKLWGNSIGMLSRRIDFHNLPPVERSLWRGASYGIYGTDDWVAYPSEKAEILNFLVQEGIPNFVSLTGDRHNFIAGRLSPELPPNQFRPIAVEFTTSSITTPTSVEAFEYIFSRRHEPPLEYFAVARQPNGSVAPTLNLSMSHGVRAARAYAEGASLGEALSLSNPEVAPHLDFVDMATHGFATARVDQSRLEVEFVSFRRPVGAGILTPLYRAGFTVPAWRAGEEPRIERHPIVGQPTLPYGTTVFNYAPEASGTVPSSGSEAPSPGLAAAADSEGR